MNLSLQHFAVGEIFALLLIFARIGTAIMLIPGIGEIFVPIRARIWFAMGVSYVLMPMLQDKLPKLPGTPLELAVLLQAEIIIGLFMGTLTKLLLGAVHTAGMVIASQSGLASAMLFDPSQETQSASLGLFLTLMAIALLFTTNTHHVMLAAFVDSYSLMKPGDFAPVEDMSDYMAKMVSSAFLMGIKMGTPLIAFSLFVNLGAGLLSRLMPTMQVFFVLMPLQLMLSFFIFATALTGMMLWYIQYVGDVMGGFLD